MAVSKKDKGTYGKNGRSGDMAEAYRVVQNRSAPRQVPIARIAENGVTSIVMAP